MGSLVSVPIFGGVGVGEELFDFLELRGKAGERDGAGLVFAFRAGDEEAGLGGEPRAAGAGRLERLPQGGASAADSIAAGPRPQPRSPSMAARRRASFSHKDPSLRAS